MLPLIILLACIYFIGILPTFFVTIFCGFCFFIWIFIQNEKDLAQFTKEIDEMLKQNQANK